MKDDQLSGRSSIGITVENISGVRDIIDQYTPQTIHEVAEAVGESYSVLANVLFLKNSK